MDRIEGYVVQYMSQMNAHWNRDYENIKKTIDAAETMVQKAVECIVAHPKLLFSANSNTSHIVQLLMDIYEVVEALKIWRNEFNQTVADLPTNSFFLREVIRKVVPDQFQKIAKDFVLNPTHRPYDSYSLVPYLEVVQEDKMRCEAILKQIKEGYYAFSSDRVVCQIWLNAAKKFPASEDVEMATDIMTLELDKRYNDIHPIVGELLDFFPNMNVETILASVRYWPDPFANVTRQFIRRKNIPNWIFKAILGLATVEDCNYSWIRKTLTDEKKHNDGSVNQYTQQLDNNNTSILSSVPSLIQVDHQTSYGSRFDLQALPEDLIYYLMTHLSFNQLKALSLTNKAMFKLVNESQHIWRSLGNKYFTNLPVNNASDFHRKYRSKFKTGKLLQGYSKWSFYPDPSSIELNGDKVIIAQLNTITILETHCLDQPQMPNHFRKKFRFIRTKLATKTSARLYNNKIYVLSTMNDGSSISIYDVEKRNERCQIPNPLNQHDLYFTIDGNSLIGKGFLMNLTTQQIAAIDCTSNLSKWIIRNDIIYGSHNINGSLNGPAQLKLFDLRMSEKLTAELHFDELRCFNVKDNDIYTVSSHINQWDKRHLSHPVRTSTDPYFHKKCKNNASYGYPTIDLTSMTVIGPDQIWDLTDFTWELTELPREKRNIINNGILVVYSADGGINVRQSACTTLSAPIWTHPELNVVLYMKQ